ncbi:MAG: DEAD/DEAH box helicase [Rhodococcus sp.]|nr:DEAD/DEAH box helicase [Rhodococcus sp. (in: high G+C Gram-positive bacteria)]
MAIVPITDDYIRGRAARSIPGASWSPERGEWVFDTDAGPDAALIALKLFPDIRLALDPSYVKELEHSATDARPFDHATEWLGERDPKVLLPGVPDSILGALYPYQAADLAYTAARLNADGAAYLGWDRGLGKTLGAITLCFVCNARRVVVVCPNSSKRSVWGPEFGKWDEHCLLGRTFYLDGTARRRGLVLGEWAADGGVLIVHYEALRLVEWKKLPPADLVIVDEAHRLANGSASGRSPKFYKALKQIRTKNKLALSGSLIVNGPEDFFGANHWLFPTVYRSKWRDWNDKYLRYVEGGFGKVLVGIKPDRLDDMRDELGAFTVVRRKEDELPGLPERIVQVVKVELSPHQRRVYNDLAERFIADLGVDSVAGDGVDHEEGVGGSAPRDGKTRIVVGSVLAQLGKLRQVACGLDLLDGELKDSSKLDLAEQLVQDNLPRKTVVFTWHRATATALHERLNARGITSAVVTGDVAMKERAHIVESFQECDDPAVLIATIKTLGESVTLHAASDLIFVESSWTPADMEQAADRVYRIGQRHRVTITNIVAADTVDETRVLPRVADKAAMRRMVFGGGDDTD